MERTKAYLKKSIPDLITLGLWMLVVGLVFTIKWCTEQGNMPICVEKDFQYWEWSTCWINGEKTKAILGKKDGVECKILELPKPIIEKCSPDYLISPDEQVIKIISPESTLSLFRESPPGSSVDINIFPKIKVNSSNITKAYLKVSIDFNQNWKQRYPNLIYWRTIAGWKATHFFAIKYFIGDLKSWGYLDVIRNAAGWVQSWPDGWLNWWYIGTDILWGRELVIDLDKVVVAADKYIPGKQYIVQNPINFIKQNKNKIIPIGVYLSDDAWTLITNMEIIYTGDENAIELVK